MTATERLHLQSCQAIEALAEDIERMARAKGFWPEIHPELEHFQKSEKLMLVVSELGECQEAIRGNLPSDKIDYTGEEEEWADALIRLLDYGRHYKLRFQAIADKIAYNANRPFKHGKAF